MQGNQKGVNFSLHGRSNRRVMFGSKGQSSRSTTRRQKQLMRA